jgi:hypothetical protein
VDTWVAYHILGRTVPGSVFGVAGNNAIVIDNSKSQLEKSVTLDCKVYQCLTDNSWYKQEARNWNLTPAHPNAQLTYLLD